jgi:hypothetical protein
LTTLTSVSRIEIEMPMGDMLSDYAVLSQSFDGGSAGQVYFLSVDVELPGLSSINQGTCGITFSIENQDLLVFKYGMSAQQGSVNASGILGGNPSHLDLKVNCDDYSGNEVYTHASFANVQLSVYNPSAGTNPIRPVAANELVNGDFEGGTMEPWETSPQDRVDIAVTGGMLVITYSRIDASLASGTYFGQILAQPSQVGQKIRIQADVHINIPDDGTKCTAQIWGGYPLAWSVVDVTISKNYPVDVLQTLEGGSSTFYLYGDCTGTGATTSIPFDNIRFTTNEI